MTVRICVTGDSNAVGVSADALAEGHSWRQRLGAGLATGGYDAALVGRTVDADGAHEAANGRSLTALRAALPEIVAENAPDILVVQVGTVTLNSPSSPEALLIDDHYRGLLSLCRQLRPLMHVVCLSLPPMVPSWTDEDDVTHTYAGSAGIAAFNQRLPDVVGTRAILVAPDVDDSDMDVIESPAPGEPGGPASWPGTHLNFDGYKAYGTAVYGVVTSLLDSGLAHVATVEVTIGGVTWRAESALFRPAVE